MDVIPDPMMNKLEELDVSVSQLKEHAQRTGVQEMSDNLETDPNLELDESLVQDVETDDEDDWNKTLLNVETTTPKKQSLAGSGTTPQMTKKIMKDSIASMKEALKATMIKGTKPNLEYYESIVRKWGSENRHHMTERMIGILADAMLSHPEMTTDALEWVLLGWHIRGEHNVIETKNIQQSMQEMVSSQLASQSAFKKSADNLIKGFNECQKQAAACVNLMREGMMRKAEPVVVPIGATKVTKPAVMSIASSSGTKKESVVVPEERPGQVNLLLQKIGKSRKEMEAFCDKKVLAMVLSNIVSGMDQEAWEDLNSFGGKLAMLEIISEDIIKATE